MNFRNYFLKCINERVNWHYHKKTRNSNKLSIRNQEYFDLISDDDIISYDISSPIGLVKMGRHSFTNVVTPFTNKSDALRDWNVDDIKDIVTTTKKEYKKMFKYKKGNVFGKTYV